MNTATIFGIITETSNPEQLSNGQTCQRIRISELPNQDRKIETILNVYDCYIYGKKQIAEAWGAYNDKLPAPPVTATVQIIGRLKIDRSGKEYNNISLRIKYLKFHYDNQP